MKESHSEVIATHAAPESCECVREDALEALIEEPAGRVIEPRNLFILREADALMASGRPHRQHRLGEMLSAPARSENHGMLGSFSHGKREISCSARAVVARVRISNP